MGESPTVFSEIHQNHDISHELRELLSTWCTGEELDEIKGLLCKLQLTKIEDIQNITNLSMNDFIQIFTNSAKLYTQCSKTGLNKITAILIKVWERKKPEIKKRPRPEMKSEPMVKEETPFLNIPRIHMSEFALIRSTMGEKYRKELNSAQMEYETQMNRTTNTQNTDPSEGSPNQRGSEQLSQSTQQSTQPGKKRKSTKDNGKKYNRQFQKTTLE